MSSDTSFIRPRDVADEHFFRFYEARQKLNAPNDLLTPFDSRTQKLTLAITESPENFIRFPGSWSLKILNRKFLMMNFFLFFPIRHDFY